MPLNYAVKLSHTFLVNYQVRPKHATPSPMRASAAVSAANGIPLPAPRLLISPGVQDPDEACYLYEYHAPLNVGTRASSTPGTMLAFVVASAMGASVLWRATYDGSID